MRLLVIRRVMPIFAVVLALPVALSTLPQTTSTAAEQDVGQIAVEDERNAAPPVVPALQEWAGGIGQRELNSATRVVVTSPEDQEQLDDVVAQVAADLRSITGWRTRIAVDETPTARDIVLELDPLADVGPDIDLAAAEGYRLDTTDGIRITSRTATGVFWGSRSLLQMLVQEGKGHATVPVGTAVDWPNHEVRGFMLDVGRRWFGERFIRDYARYMSWFKLNTFQIHLNDNEIDPPDGDWSRAQSAFRLASTNPRFAGLAADDGSFTRPEWAQLEDVAASHHVTLVPEIDAPAHSRAFIEFDQDLGLNGGNSDLLDLTKPETTQFMKDIFTEFIPWFEGPGVHVGADEYPREHEAEYRGYFNDITRHVRELNKHPAAWGSLSVMSGNAEGYDRDVTINSWNNDWYGPNTAIEDGYEFINTNDSLLYIVPFADYYHGDGLDGRWLFDNWEPHVFPGDQSVSPDEPLLKGAMSAVWNDLIHEQYDGMDVHRLVEPTFGILAHKMWRGNEPDLTYESLMDRVSELGVGPGMESLTTTLPDAGDRRLAVEVDTVPPLPADESVLVSTTVTNQGTADLARLDANLSLNGDGVTTALEEAPDTTLEPGESTTWTWRVTADSAAESATVPGTVELSAQHRGVTLTTRRQIPVLIIDPAPDGQRHLSFGATATASSVEDGLDQLTPQNVNDGDLETRWASDYTDDEWVQLALNDPAEVSSVRLSWEDACAESYQVQVSTDGAEWRNAATVTESNCDDETIQLATEGAVSHVRIQGIDRATSYGYSLREMWLFGPA